MLPTLPHKQTATRNQVTEFRGLNLSENIKEGDLKDSSGITSEKYPVLSQRKGRSKVHKTDSPITEWSNPTQIWEWDGKMIVIDDGTLYYDGVEKCHVSDGQKQFAVVNTKMIIWPDKIMIDLSEETVLVPGQYDVMDAKVVTGANVSMTTTVITIPKLSKIYSGARSIGAAENETYAPCMWTFGNNTSAIESCWDSVNSQWIQASLEALAEESALWAVYATEQMHQIIEGDIIIPKVINGTYSNSWAWNSAQEMEYPENDSGIYGIVTDRGSYVSPIGNLCNYFTFDVYQCAAGTSAVLTDMFAVGDWIALSETGNTDVDGVKKKISAITDTTITVSTAYESAFSGEKTGVVIQKQIPDMDFICEKDNRLWGCSNKDKTIYASSLGIPTDFYTMEGVDTDAYALAIGSEGDFTGIANYNSGVCFFKADRMIKMLGNYPSDFYMNEYRIAGIQSGSNRSTIIINEVLYYKGVHGIFAYTGGQPSLISYNLGNDVYTEAVTGSDGFNLCVCMKNAAGQYGVYTYNLNTGLWVKESNECILSFTNIDSKLYALKEDEEQNEIFCYDGNGLEYVPWYAEFAPFIEGTLNRRNYLRLILRIDMSANSTLTVYTKIDRGEWQSVFTRTSDAGVTFTVPVPMNRCDRFYIKLAGTGRVLVRSMAREYIGGSEHD